MNKLKNILVPNMNKTNSFLWGLLCNLIGGFLVAILVYWLFLKEKRVDTPSFILGFFAFLIATFLLIGSIQIWGIIITQIM